MRALQQSITNAPDTEHEPIVGFVIGVTLLLLCTAVGTIGFMWIEGWGFVDAVYMTVITLSTVGFGEVQELSQPGKIFATFLIVAGIGTGVYTFSRLGQVLFEGELVQVLGVRRMYKAIQNLQDHYIVCGYGRLGAPVADGLAKEGKSFCIIDDNPANLDMLRRKNYLHVHADCTEEAVLAQAGIQRASTVLALLPTDADNLYLTLAAKEANPHVTVIARALDTKAERRLMRSGADRVVSPYRIAGDRIIHAAIRPNSIDTPHLSGETLGPMLMEQIRVPENSTEEFHLHDLVAHPGHDLIVVAIQKPDEKPQFNPTSNHVIVAGDTLTVIGAPEDVELFRNLLV